MNQFEWWKYLDKIRGSRPRCVLLTDGSRDVVAARLTRIIDHRNVTVSASDQWMPVGKPTLRKDGKIDVSPSNEAMLPEADFLPLVHRKELLDWWLVHTRHAKTPTWDFAGSCTVGDKPGLLLIEAKAHLREFDWNPKRHPTSDNGWENHKQIGRCISDASANLQQLTGRSWGISRDSRYQLSNRIAWSWKLADLGYCVVLMYLGFLNCTDMNDFGPLIVDEAGWRKVMFEYSDGIMSSSYWGKTIMVGNGQILPLLRVFDQNLGG